MEKKIKIFVPYGSTGYTNWITNRELVTNIKDADLVFLTGGEDCDPALYGDPKGKYTYFTPEREKAEMGAIKEAISLGIPMFGTCKGLQMLCVGAGGKLVQDMDHPGGHGMTTKDGTTFQVNSLHHQCINPYVLPADEYEILGVADVRSDIHLNGENKDISEQVPEDIEAAYFPKIKALGVQHHPEMMWYSSKTKKNNPYFTWLRDQVWEKLHLEVEGVQTDSIFA